MVLPRPRSPKAPQFAYLCVGPFRFHPFFPKRALHIIYRVGPPPMGERSEYGKGGAEKDQNVERESDARICGTFRG